MWSRIAWELVKTQIAGPTPIVCDLVGLRQEDSVLRICISNILLVDPDAAGLGTTL